MGPQEAIDWVEIFQLKSKYSWYYDTPELEKLLDLFTEDAVLDMGPYGKHTGREAIRQLYTENIASPDVPFLTMHVTTNPLIEIDGDEATGKWFLLDRVLSDGPERTTLGWAAVYHERYRRVDGRWMISHIRMQFIWSRDLGRVKGAPPKLDYDATPAS